MIRTIHNLYQADTGLKTDHVMSFGYVMPGSDWAAPGKRVQLLDRALEKLRSLPGVTSVGLTNPLPLSGGGNQTSFIPEGMEDPGPGKWFSTENNAASRDYFETMRIPLLRGRGFTDEEKADDPHVCLIDSRFAETHFAGQDPIGKRIQFGGHGNPNPSYSTIIGIVGHVENYGVGEKTRVQLYYPYHQITPGYLTFVLRTSIEPAALAPAVRTAMRELEPTLPVFNLRTMDDLFDGTVTNQRIMLTILSALAGLAILLAAIGLYGVLSYVVGQRTREVGIRIALGATNATVRKLIIGQGLRLAALGLAVGVLGAVMLAKLMGSLIYGVSPYDPLSLGAVALLIVAIGVLSSWFPARRATRVDPMTALRSE